MIMTTQNSNDFLNETRLEDFLEEADPWENDTLTIPTDQEEFIDTFKEENNEALITRRMLFTFGIRNAIHV